MQRSRRVVTIGLALAGAGLLALGVQGGRWWEVGEVTIGPISSHRCFEGDCKVVGLAWVGATEGWVRAGIATYAAAMLAAALLVFSAGALAARRVIRVVAKSGLVATITAGIAGVSFLALFPELTGASLGRGTWFYLGGVVLAVAAQISIIRFRAAAPVASAS